MKLDSKLIGTRIMQRRKACGYTQEQLAEKIGFSKNHISSVERGIYVPTTQFIFRICDVLGDTPDYYLIGKTSGNADEIISLIRTLPPSAQEIICKLIETYIDNVRAIWRFTHKMIKWEYCKFLLQYSHFWCR